MTTENHEFVEGVRGKVVDRIVVSNDSEETALEIRFSDNTSFNVRLASAQIQILGIDMLGWKNGDSRVLKTFL